MKTKVRFTLVWALTLSLSAFADWTTLDSDSFQMADPPKEGSAAYKQDYQDLHELQEARTKDDCRIARAQRFPAFGAFYEIEQSPLTEKQAADAKALINRVIRLTVKISTDFKKKYTRMRPYDVDEEIKPCAQKPGGSTSYPSSHAAAATSSACVLAKMYPANADTIKDWGDYLGRLRAIVGVHHPSDVEAGQKLGQEICEKLLEHEDFKMEL